MGKYTLARFREEGAKHGGIDLLKVKEELEQTVDDKLVEKIRGGLRVWTILVAIGLPLGMYIVGRPRLQSVALGFANIFQTIPSLALFGFLGSVCVLLGDWNNESLVGFIVLLGMAALGQGGATTAQ